MKKHLIFCIVFVLLLTISCQAIDGYIQLDWGTMQEDGHTRLKLWEDFGKFRIGGDFICLYDKIVLKDGYFPAGVPNAQYYGLFMEYKVSDKITLTLNEWCNHWFQDYPYWRRVGKDITIGARYDF